MNCKRSIFEGKILFIGKFFEGTSSSILNTKLKKKNNYIAIKVINF
jgi:hypothetical protein